MKYLPLTQPLFSNKAIDYVTDCINTTWVSAGKYVQKFEKKFAAFCNLPYAVTTSSGTAALHLGLLSVGVRQGDEVIVPDITYVSSANVVSYIGARPVFVDVDPVNWNIDPKKIEEKITKKTKAIMVVHLFGHPSDMDPIRTIARKYKIEVIEDACESHGALYKKSKTGSLSTVGCFSFSGAKTITTGEGGMVVTASKQIYEKILNIQSNYQDKKRHFSHTDIGYPYRYTNLQAALGLAQLERLNSLVNIKIKNAAKYNELLKDERIIQLPPQEPWAKNVFWLYSVVIKKPGLRSKLMQYLHDKNVQTRPFFAPLHTFPMYQDKKNYPVSEFIAENGICLPSGLTLTTKDIEYVSAQIKSFLKTYA